MLHPCQFDWKCRGWNEGHPDAEESLWTCFCCKATNSRRACFSWRGVANTRSGTQYDRWAQSGRLGIQYIDQQLRALCSAVLERWWKCKKPTSSSYSRNPGRFWSCWDGRSGCGNIAARGGFDYNCGNSNLGAISLVVDYHHRHHRSASTSSSRSGGNCKRCCSAWWICSCGRWFRYKEKARASQSSDRRAASGGDQKPIHSSNQSFLSNLDGLVPGLENALHRWRAVLDVGAMSCEISPGMFGELNPATVQDTSPMSRRFELTVEGQTLEVRRGDVLVFEGGHLRQEPIPEELEDDFWLPLHDLPRPTVQRSFAAMWALGNLWSVLSAASSSWLQLPRLPASGWKGGKRWEYLMGVFVSFWEADGRQSVVILPCKDTAIFKCARTDLYPRCHSGSFQSESITSANQNRWKQVQRAGSCSLSLSYNCLSIMRSP